MENNNLDFWNKYKTVPERALKAFDNGKFKGTDINTMWRLKCLTETYGMCGIGWYFKIVKTWSETTPNGEMFAFAEIELFIKNNGEWSMPISGNGGNKIARQIKAGGLSTSDEAYKMAVTDAIGVACRNLGMGADVYWENDKTKYTENAETKIETITEEQKELLIGFGVNLEEVKAVCKVAEINDIPSEYAQRIINKKEREKANAK